MRCEIWTQIFGALLLVCLCHSARFKGAENGDRSLTNSSMPLSQGRTARCLGIFKEWLGLDAEIVSGNPDDIRFILYPNPLVPNMEEELRYRDLEGMKRAGIQVGQPWKIIIHGFTKNYVSEAVQTIKNAYLLRMAHDGDKGFNYNVVLVDWEPLGNPKIASSLFYRYAVANVEVVGRRVGEFVGFLFENGLARSWDEIHIIGFSLGAHVAGNAGNTIRMLTDQLPARITGLDPAGPAFYERLSYSHRHLQKTDARFVDIVHSNKGAMGIFEDLGHVDFYPNDGGPIQWRCEREYEQRQAEQVASSSGGIWDTKFLMLNSCSHNKAPEFFAMSILNPTMLACRCSSYNEFKSGCPCHEKAVFGEYCDSRIRGRFYFDI